MQLSLENVRQHGGIKRERVVILIGGVHQGTFEAVRFARTLSKDVTAVHVSIDPLETEKIRQKWEIYGDGYRLVILESPYRLMIEPLLEYLSELEQVMKSDEIITIVVPEFVPDRWWHNLLHTQAAVLLRLALLFKPGIVITDVPYQLESRTPAEREGS